MEKARQRRGANAPEEALRAIPNLAPVGVARGPKQPNDDIRSILKVGRFDAAEEHLVTLIAPESIESESLPDAFASRWSECIRGIRRR